MISQMRAEEVVFIMDKLRTLEVYPNLLNEIVTEDVSMENVYLSEQQLRERDECLKSTKGHLFYLIPLFSEFIGSEEKLIKLPLMKIFTEIALSKGIHKGTTFISKSSSSLDFD